MLFESDLLMLDEKPIERFCLQVKTELEALTDVLRWFEQVATPVVSKQAFWQCQVAIAEGFTNTVRHAHKGLPRSTAIDLEVNLFLRCLEMKIWNSGKPFDLETELETIDPKECNLLDKEDGRGLFFMQKLTDEIRYIRVPKGRNCLVMRKKIDSEAGN